jgi:hypothetical protein
MAALPRAQVPQGEPPYHFSEDEAQLVARYRFYFTYPALARQSASVLAAIGLTALRRAAPARSARPCLGKDPRRERVRWGARSQP